MRLTSSTGYGSPAPISTSPTQTSARSPPLRLELRREWCRSWGGLTSSGVAAPAGSFQVEDLAQHGEALALLQIGDGLEQAGHKRLPALVHRILVELIP